MFENELQQLEMLRHIIKSFLNKHKTFTRRRRNRSTSRTELARKNRTIRNCNLFEYGDQSSISNHYSYSEFIEIPKVQDSEKDIYDDISEWFQSVEIEPFRSLNRKTQPSDQFRCDQESVSNFKDRALLNQFRVFKLQDNLNCNSEASLQHNQGNNKSILKTPSDKRNPRKAVKEEEEEHISLSQDLFEENSFLSPKCHEKIQNEEEDHIPRCHQEETAQISEKADKELGNQRPSFVHSLKSQQDNKENSKLIEVDRCSFYQNIDETHSGKKKKIFHWKSRRINLSEIKRKLEENEGYRQLIVESPKNRQVDSEFDAGVHAENLSTCIDQNENELPGHVTLSLISDNSDEIGYQNSAMRNTLEKEEMNNFESQTNSNKYLIDRSDLTSPSLFGEVNQNVLSYLDSEICDISLKTPESLKKFVSGNYQNFLSHSEESSQDLTLEGKMKISGDLKSQEADMISFREGSFEEGDDQSMVFGSLKRVGTQAFDQDSDLESLSSSLSLMLKMNRPVKRKNLDENITSPLRPKKKMNLNYNSRANTSTDLSSLVEVKKSKCLSWILDNEMMKYSNTHRLGTSDTTKKYEAEKGCRDEDMSSSDTLSGVDFGDDMDEQNDRIDQELINQIASPISDSSLSIKY